MSRPKSISSAAATQAAISQIEVSAIAGLMNPSNLLFPKNFVAAKSPLTMISRRQLSCPPTPRQRPDASDRVTGGGRPKYRRADP
jgi:hypothetical protein